ncbi:MAG: hypothetical protein ACTSQ6_10630, partial [Candidatus Heimdallarchaeaceae archaeon]
FGDLATIKFSEIFANAGMYLVFLSTASVGIVDGVTLAEVLVVPFELDISFSVLEAGVLEGLPVSFLLCLLGLE